MTQTRMSSEEIAKLIPQSNIASGWIDAKNGLQINCSQVGYKLYTGVINAETREITWYK